jgi:hypothetical protein
MFIIHTPYIQDDHEIPEYLVAISVEGSIVTTRVREDAAPFANESLAHRLMEMSPGTEYEIERA